MLGGCGLFPQMLMSFVYFTSILALGVLPRKMSRFDTPSGPVKSESLGESVRQ